jgi:acetate kinase
MPGKPQVAVFDTAFHHTIPDYAYIYPIPYKYYENNHLRRYGFHGTSHRYVLAEALKILGGTAKGTRIITCHLGNGSSLAAIKDGKCIDTTMGVTPLEGVPMGTRSGSIDPTLIELIAEIDNLTLEQTMHILNKESGVFGISGVSSDFRDLQHAAGIDIDSGHKAHDEGSRRAELALEIFNYQVAKFIGAYIAVMGGIDALVFTAGVGENSAHTRKGICEILNGIGICIDEKKNAVRAPATYEDITGEGSIANV